MIRLTFRSGSWFGKFFRIFLRGLDVHVRAGEDQALVLDLGVVGHQLADSGVEALGDLDQVVAGLDVILEEAGLFGKGLISAAGHFVHIVLVQFVDHVLSHFNSPSSAVRIVVFVFCEAPFGVFID